MKKILTLLVLAVVCFSTAANARTNSLQGKHRHHSHHSAHAHGHHHHGRKRV